MKTVINFRAAAFAVSGLIVGILFSYCLLLKSFVGSLIVVMSAALVFVISVFFSSKKFKGIGKLLCLLFFALCALFGGVKFSRIVQNYGKADLDGHILTVSGKATEVTVKENFAFVVLSDVTVSGAVNGKSYYKTALFVYGESDIRLGDRIIFTAALSDRSIFYEGKFSASAIEQGIKYSAEINAASLTIAERFPNLFEKVNLFIFDTLKAGLKEEEFSVAYAMMTGNSDYIAEEILATYRAAGVAHVFAVSGLHIGFFATALYFIFGKLKVNSLVSFLITLACCTFYAGVCGFSASSVRAVIMFFFLNFAKILGLKYDGISSVCSAAFIILAVSPVQLFCVGFQLSFAVVLSIIILFVPLKKLLKFLPDKISAALSLSFSAEVGGIPVLLYAFGEFASLSLFVNLLFIPLVGVVYVALIVCTVLGGIFSPTVFLFVPQYTLFGLNFVINAVDFKAFLIGGFTFGAFAAAYYGVILTAGGIFNFGKILKPVVCVLLAMICAFGTLAETTAKRNRLCGTIIGSESLSAVLFTARGESVLVISDISYKNFSLYRLKRAARKIDGDNVSVILMKTPKDTDNVALTVRLKSALNVSALYYYGERDAVTENVLKKLFLGFTVTDMADGDTIKTGCGDFTFLFGGRCLTCRINGYNTAVFSSLADTEDFSDLSSRINAAVCYDKHNTISKHCTPERVFSFRKMYGYADGETQGNLTLYFG